MKTKKFPTQPVEPFDGAIGPYDECTEARSYDKYMTLKINEATSLTLGLNPRTVGPFLTESDEPISALRISKWHDRLTEIKRAVAAGAITRADNPNSEITMETLIYTDSVHKYFHEGVSTNNSDLAKNITLQDTERLTLLKLVFGMAIDAYEYNPYANRNDATGDNRGSIAAQLKKHGISINSDTVRRYLTEAKEAIPYINSTKLGDVTDSVNL